MGEHLIGIPAYASGGRVNRTGIALVHEGEYIVPAPGSSAEIAPVDEVAGGGQEIHYYFPVEIEIVGELDEAQIQRVAQHVFAEMETALRSQL
jgi:hypothetical protein